MLVFFLMHVYWPVYRDLVMMTSPYDDVIIHKLQYATTWLVEGRGRGGRQAVTERSEKKKKIKKLK